MPGNALVHRIVEPRFGDLQFSDRQRRKASVTALFAVTATLTAVWTTGWIQVTAIGITAAGVFAKFVIAPQLLRVFKISASRRRL